jgi:hypothetical protein
MYPKEIYKLGINLGLNKQDIESVLSSTSDKKEEINTTSPADVYKGVGRYGTVSIKDFE